MEKDLEVDAKGLNHEKSQVFFLNPTLQVLLENKEKTDNNENTKILHEFCKTFFQQREAEPKLSLQQYLTYLDLTIMK